MFGRWYIWFCLYLELACSLSSIHSFLRNFIHFLLEFIDIFSNGYVDDVACLEESVSINVNIFDAIDVYQGIGSLQDLLLFSFWMSIFRSTVSDAFFVSTNTVPTFLILSSAFWTIVVKSNGSVSVFDFCQIVDYIEVYSGSQVVHQLFIQ